MAAEEASSSSVKGRGADKGRRSARDFALDRLGRRSHSTAELSRKMSGAGYFPEEVETTLDYLRERGYLDDARFAKDFAHARAERRLWGPRRVRQRLQTLGVSESFIDEALSDAFAAGETKAGIRALERFSRYEKKGQPLSRAKARAYRHLVAKGFAPDTAYELVSSAHFEDTERLDENDFDTI